MAKTGFLPAIAILAIQFSLIVNSNGLIHLRTIDGKAFHWEFNIPARSWTQAQAYCQSNGLELASIETRNQTQFLARAIYDQPSGFLSHSWTAGTERRSIENFQWNNTESRLDPEAIQNLEYWDSTNHYCIALYIGVDANYTFYAKDCTTISVGVLCQE